MYLWKNLPNSTHGLIPLEVFSRAKMDVVQPMYWAQNCKTGRSFKNRDLDQEEGSTSENSQAMLVQWN